MNVNTRHSKQRDAIYSALVNTERHPSAESIYEELKNDFPSLSLATVYRNLNRFCEEGRAVKIDVGDGTVRYDGWVDPHAHFYCTGCNKVIDVLKENDFTPAIETKYNVKLQGYSLVFYGKCETCQG